MGRASAPGARSGGTRRRRGDEPLRARFERHHAGERRLGVSFQHRAGGARGARRRLRAVIRACLETAVESRDFWTVFIEFWGEALHDRRLAAVNRQAYARARRLIGAALARGRATGEVRAVSLEEASAVVLGLLDGLSLQLTFDRRLMTLPRAARLAETVLARYLSPGDRR